MGQAARGAVPIITVRLLLAVRVSTGVVRAVRGVQAIEVHQVLPGVPGTGVREAVREVPATAARRAAVHPVVPVTGVRAAARGVPDTGVLVAVRGVPAQSAVLVLPVPVHPEDDPLVVVHRAVGAGTINPNILKA